ncbi:hypothetical protein [Paenibacillus sabinae]|uniref:Uncharacterized protein n=1 Tax=Paenibacillus sabinae T27 TaxID=1268072 RepID=X4ZUX0_9BACL|nr:hypothetical protein [Paenibacillus sabinae]AHV96118.1 hypothetical protein PSAB_05910 [Paenibacillus sabinae T27]
MPVDYIVDTTCGRHFCWSATSYENLILSIQDRGYMPTFIMPLSEYEARERAIEKERELKESA